MKKHKIGVALRALLFSTVLLAFCAAPAMAFNDEAAYEGYIFKLAEDMPARVCLMAEDAEGVAAIDYAEGYYTAESLADIRTFANADYIEVIEPNYNVSLFADPNDFYYETQQKQYMDLIKASMAWDAGLNGNGATVAVIDSGLVPNHVDMDYTNVLTGVNYMGEIPTSNTVDSTGHGSFVSSIIAAKTNNGLGIAGIAGAVKLLPLKCFQTGNDATVSMIVSAIGYAVEQGVDVINMSFGLTAESPVLEQAIENAAAAGVILVAAAGNDGNDVFHYPANYDCVVGVGSVNSLGVVSEFSQKNSSVYITAPGEDVAGIGYTTSNVYCTGSGTSYAAPFIAAVAAMAKAYDVDIETAVFQSLLRASAADKGAEGYDTAYGWGVLDMEQFVAELQETYAIHYVLNDGTFADPLSVPQSFGLQTETIVLPTPQKKAYAFDGWYDNAAFTGNAITQIPAGSLGERTFYAKWRYHAQADTAIQSLKVSGRTAVAAGGNAYTVVLPYSTVLSELTALQIAVTPVSASASVGLPVSADGGTTWTVPVTAGNGVDVDTYTITVILADAFVPVTAISGVAANATTNDSLLLSATVAPVDADKQEIVWTVKDAAATNAVITGNSLLATAAGNAVITATIANGLAEGTDYVQDFTVQVSAPVITGGGGGGGGGDVPVEEEAEVIILSADAAVSIPCKLEGSQVTLVTDEPLLAKLAENAKANGTLLLDATSVKGAQSLNMSTKALAYFAEKAFPEAGNGVLQMKLPQAEITLDALALASLLEQVTEKEVQFGIEAAAKAGMNEKQQRAAEDLLVYDITVTSGSTEISKFKGQVNLGLSYTPSSAEAVKAAAVWYLDDAGKRQLLDATYDAVSQKLYFNVSHFSYYAVGQEPMLLWQNPFQDIAANAWYYKAVRFVNYHQIYSGVAEHAFAPQTAMTRAMFVTALSRLEGAQKQTATSTFTDVPNGEWYSNAVQWAIANGVVTGMAKGIFAPEQAVSREQIAVMLYSYAKASGIETKTNADMHQFTDSGAISSWALTGVKWAVGVGLLNGKEGGILAPDKTATRAEVAIILQRFAENIKQ